MDNFDKILKDLKEFGISKSNVYNILNPNEIEYYKQLEMFYTDALKNENVKQKINEIKKGNTDLNGKYKGYEITHDEILCEPLTFNNIPLVQLYLSNNIIKVAKAYLGEEIKLRNPLAWIHPSTNNKKEIRSQKWHRDQEDTMMLKVFILFSNVTENNGPTQYVKSTNFSGKYKNIAPNMTWLTNHWSNKNSFVNKCYNFIRNKIPLNYPIPKDHIVKAIGEEGTIFFIDTNGLHKGGLVEEGMRLMTHCNFLKKSAPMLKNGMPLEHLNSDNKLFSFDYNSETFKSFDSEIKNILN
tara:strand:+ start:230 stop:1120 length:891 start_codon:yes stop_codon:yes gene_type:complete